ncbi:MAG: HAMP domain-containing sensor histidine kinase, partial [Planctomycetota bacterium]
MTMRSPWHIALIFAASLALLLAATGWITAAALRFERAEAEARRQAALEESVRLALWRMDSALAPLIAQEHAWPYFVYAAFYPAEAAYTRMFNRAEVGEVQMPSPLLAPESAFVRLYFQFNPDGTLTSPQVPSETTRELAVPTFTTEARISAAEARMAQLREKLPPAALVAALPAPARTPAHLVITRELVHDALVQPPGQGAASRPGPQAAGDQRQAATGEPPSQRSAASRPQQIAEAPVQQQELQQQPGPQQTVRPGPQRAMQQQGEWNDYGQVARNAMEYQARAQSLQKGQVQNALGNLAFSQRRSAPTDVVEGVFQPLWIGGELLLARRVALGGREYIQGAWLDWDALRPWLLNSIEDLLPGATLEPAPGTAAEAAHARLLAGLPIRLVVPTPAGGGPSVRPQVWVPLAAAWACVLLAAAAVGALLVGTVSLSERRAAFVSAVTHELRTPLTTFRLYTEMLAGGLVRDETKRGQYLSTLQAEASRLGHLVENVLTYARLERRARPAHQERVRASELIERVAPRLAERAAQANMELCVENACGNGAHDASAPGPNASGVRELYPNSPACFVRADPGAVEQILFNLVDNACKYAARATDRRIHLRLSPASGGDDVEIAVCDHGPGLGPGEVRTLFRPFQKSARDAANSAPGVGLGLALSRRLAGAMRGDLRLEPADGGACFV